MGGESDWLGGLVLSNAYTENAEMMVEMKVSKLTVVQISFHTLPIRTQKVSLWCGFSRVSEHARRALNKY